MAQGLSVRARFPEVTTHPAVQMSRIAKRPPQHAHTMPQTIVRPERLAWSPSIHHEAGPKLDGMSEASTSTFPHGFPEAAEPRNARTNHPFESSFRDWSQVTHRSTLATKPRADLW